MATIPDNINDVRPIEQEPRVWPLSAAQKRLWLLQRLQPESNTYNDLRVLRICGPLDVCALLAGFEQIHRRHEILRTAIRVHDGEPRQIVGTAGSLDYAQVDLRGLPVHQRDAEWDRLARQEQAQKFDFENGRLLRVKLIQLADDQHILLFAMHHIVCDRWSIHILWKELAECYRAALQNRLPILSELPCSYGEFSKRQNEELLSPRTTAHLDYWQKQLANLTTLEMPTDFVRSALPGSRGARCVVRIPRDLVSQLKLLARRERVTPFMVLLAAFQTLLHRHSGQHDVVIGTPTAGRMTADTESLIGFFISTVALRANFSGDPTFRELLAQVRDTTSAGLEHQDVPFEKVVEVVQCVRDPSRHPLVQFLFSFQNGPPVTWQLDGLAVELIDVDYGKCKFDFWLNLRIINEEWTGFVEYNADLFEHDRIQRLINQFLVLLDGIAAAPETPVAALPLLADHERNQLIVGWNDTTTDYPRNKTIHELFAEQSAARPDAIAVVEPDRCLTYAQLDLWAERVASRLRDSGIAPETPIVVLIERSIELIVGMLGILKAGGAYVPVNPSDPPERIRSIVNQFPSPIVLDAAAIKAVKTLSNVAKSDEAQAGASPASQYPMSPAERLAYIMWTSGSTGEPKGVCVTHRGVVRLVKQTTWFNVSPTDRFLQYASPAFDASTFEIWGCLLNGGQLILPPPGQLSLQELGQTIRDNHITVLWLTAGLFHLMVDHRLEDLKGVRQLLAGGDVLSPSHVRRALEGLPQTTVINGYGPTENTTFSSCHVMTSQQGVGLTVSIGRPISNSQIYVLDSFLQPVPVGVTGEICVAGDGLARGYYACPDLTAERFVPDPFGPGQSRLYKTGDLGRYRSDGTLEFLGRCDSQVKIRGHRVELREVEAAIMRHPDVRQCVVAARNDSIGGKCLVGYVVPASATLRPVDLRRHVGELLPGNLIPAHFVILDAIPLTPLGKVDYASLPAPDPRSATIKGIGARDTMELQLTKLWERVLSIRPIGIQDNFFDLGGQSLQAAELLEQVAELTGKNLPLATLFACPTIEFMAKALKRHQWSPPWKALVPVQSTGSRPPLFIVPPAGGNVLRFAELAQCLGPDQPVFGLEPVGQDGMQKPLDRVEEMASLYLKEIRELHPQGPYFLVGICFGGLVAWEMARQLSQQNEQVPLLALLDSGAPRHGPGWTTKAGVRRFIERVRNRLRSEGPWDSIRNITFGRWKQFQRRFNDTEKRYRQLLDAHLCALSAYKASSYTGRVLYIQSEESTRQPQIIERWSQLSVGPFEHLTIRGATHNDLLLSSRFSPELARILREQLDRYIPVDSATHMNHAPANRRDAA